MSVSRASELDLGQTPTIYPLQASPSAASSVADNGAASLWAALESLPSVDTQNVSYLAAAGFAPFSLQPDAVRSVLSLAPVEFSPQARISPMTISLPSPDGSLQRFTLQRTTVMAPELAAKFPEIQTYIGQGIDDATATLALDFTTQGMHASVLSANGDWYVDPYLHLRNDMYVAYYRRDLLATSTFACNTIDELAAESSLPLAADPEPAAVPGVLGNMLRVYDLAISTTGEYTAFHGGTVAGGLSAVVTSVSRLNQIYERDFAIRMQLVANNDLLIFTNSSTDPFTSPGTPSTTNSQNQSTLDSVIGSANYDIGHVYHRVTSSSSNNGLAGGIGTVGQSGVKGQGFSAHVSPVNDPFVIDFVAHEMGHQFGGRHTFNSCGGSAGDSTTFAVEPGSGATIMAYAGICNSNENLQPNSDAMFHAVNYIHPTTGAAHQILQYTLTDASSDGYTSATLTSTGNSIPTADAGLDYTIPRSTPFALTAAGTDADPDTLSYSWEQMNGGSAVTMSSSQVPSSTRTTGPVFRTFLPTTSPTRVFPKLSTILAGGTGSSGEQLPSVARSMRFALVVRDNRAGGGGIALDRMNLTFVNTGAAFAISSFNSSSTLTGGSSQTIAWNVAGTTANGINTANVKILMSTDGGNTFPITLVETTPNDGTQQVQMPYNTGSTQVRFKVEAIGNIFFDINNANLTITNVAQTSAIPGTPDLTPGSDSGVSDSDNLTRLGNNSAGNALTFLVPGTIAGATVKLFSDNALVGTAVASGTDTLVTTDGVTIIFNGPHSITASQIEPGKSESAKSAGLDITVDGVAPTLTQSGSFEFQAAQKVRYEFSEPVFNFLSAGNFTVQDRADDSSVAFALSTATNVADLTFPGGLGDANFRAIFDPTGVTDDAGNPLSLGSTLNFSFLNADASLDGMVDTQDFNLLAGHFGAVSGTFSEGNFDYADGIDSADFNLLIAHYGKRLPTPVAPLPAGEMALFSTLPASFEQEDPQNSEVV